jgi:signal transduction histidine kinase
VASFAGYRVAAAALRPVERMRARAQAIGAGDLHERLPEPGSADEIDRLAVTLNDLLARLDRAFEHERRLVGDASHELRTPISVLRTRLDVALRQEHDLEGLRRVLAEAHADSRRLSRLADDLLLLARADQGRMPLRPEPLAVDELLRAAAARGREVAAAAGRTITVRRGGGADAVVLADPDRTAQVLDNLVFNSLRHGGGSVELAAERQGGLVVIRVGDDGPGYPEEFLDRAFERFSQADPGRAGAGLGLAIAEAITTAQGGTIAAANRPEGGAVTTVTLPAA